MKLKQYVRCNAKKIAISLVGLAIAYFGASMMLHALHLLGTMDLFGMFLFLLSEPITELKIITLGMVVYVIGRSGLYLACLGVNLIREQIHKMIEDLHKQVKE